MVDYVPCGGPMGTTKIWKNNGKYLSCVAESSKSFVDLLLISDVERGLIVSKAAQLICGKK
jgi:hypothetical protein